MNQQKTGEFLKHLRKEKGLTQEQLAEKIGVSRQTVSKWEGGQSTPDVERLVVLADCFGITVDALIRGVDISQTELDADSEPRNTFDLITILGVVICILGLLCMMLLCVIQIVHPATMDALNGSSVVTLSGTGIVFGFCMLAVAIGLVIVLRRK